MIDMDEATHAIGHQHLMHGVVGDAVRDPEISHGVHRNSEWVPQETVGNRIFIRG